MKINKLPYKIEVDDYHEFDTIQDYLRTLVPGMIVEEIGYLEDTYVGIVYYKTTPKALIKALKEKIEKEIANNERL